VRLEADGSIDTSFGTGSLATHPMAGSQTSALALQDDGAIVVGGSVSTPAGGDWVLTRFDAAGQVDPSFGIGGTLVTDPLGGADDLLAHLLVQPDGVVAVGQSINDEYWFVLVRYVNGAVDPLFGVLGVTQANFASQGGGDSEFPYAATTDHDGNIVVIGRATTDARRFAMMRFEPNGTLDASFGTGGGVLSYLAPRAASYTGAIAPDGKIVLAGNSGFDDEAVLLARYFGGGADLPRCPHTRDFVCHELPADGTATLTIRNDRKDASDALTWQWAGRVGSQFGDPTATDGYALCLYQEDDLWPPLRYAAPVPAGGVCRGKPCWKGSGGGFKYASRDGVPGGVTSLGLKQSGGKTKLTLKGKGAHLGGVNLLPLSLPIVVQLRNDKGQCWSASLDTVLVNEQAHLKARTR
jgi:uncharacterized delta-60 repeat protein